MTILQIGCDFIDGDFITCDLIGCDLIGCDFVDCDSIGCDFIGCDFIGIIYLKMRKLGFMYPPAGHFLSYQSSQVHYYVWGSGRRVIFAFHGYGETAASFSFMGDALRANRFDAAHGESGVPIGGEIDEGSTSGFMLIAIDLPYHGRTDWRQGLSFSPEQLFEIMKAIAALHSTNPDQSPSPNANSSASTRAAPPWRLVGYSMGGRIVLQLFENHPASFDKLILLAPDGLNVNIWYRLATRTIAGNVVFRWTMRRPGWLFLLLRLCNWLRLVNPSIYKFSVHYIDDRVVRQELYTRWTVMRDFRPHLAHIASLIRQAHLPVVLVYGRYDRIIRWERGERFRRRDIEDSCQLVLLDTGHQLLRTQFLPDLLAAIIG